MTALNTVTETPIRELTADETHAISGAAFSYTSPLAICGFNPQPDPPAFQLASPQLAR